MPRQQLSQHIAGIADTQRRSTVGEFRAMQRDAEQLEQRAARADELEQRGSLTVRSRTSTGRAAAAVTAGSPTSRG